MSQDFGGSSAICAFAVAAETFQAHSKEFNQDAYKRAAEPKELLYVQGAGHVDLYDRVSLIPFAKLNDFFSKNLK